MMSATESSQTEIQRPTMGSLLLSNGKILAEDAERIIFTQKKYGLKFGDAAVKLGLVTEEDIQQCLSSQFDFNYLNSDDASVNKKVVTAFSPNGSVIETLKGVRSQLALRWFTEHKMLIVAAVEGQEGASFTAANLAVLFSQMGQKTLLVDANFRQPTQHEYFKYAKKEGLSDLIAGRATFTVIANHVNLPHLYILSAGTIPPNPLELLSRNKLSEILHSLETHFEIIIFDCPAIDSYYDSLALAKWVKGVAIVVQENKTPLKRLEQALDNIEIAGACATGIILNKGL